ncbi:MAG: hypothetical protein ACOX7B_05815 [Christensenellales bacterium]|jgi:putative aldouronate transport system substrate-binding protein
MLRSFCLFFLALLVILSGTALADVTPNGEFPIVDTPTEITIWTSIPGTQIDYTNNATTKYYEKKTGIHVKWIEVPDAERQTLFNTSLASNSHPDYYMTGIESTALMSYYEDGVIIPLNDLIDEYSVYLKQLLDENPSIREAITAPDGNIYSFPMVDYIPAQNVDAKIYVYKDWLRQYMEKTGKPKPNTAAGLEDMLLYFRDHDMNENGDTSDEIVLTGHYQYNNTGIPVYYMLNGFCYIPNDYFYVGDDGRICSDVKTDAFREGLRYANRLYEQGLIDEGVFVQSLTTFRSLTTTTKDKVIVGACAAPYPFRVLTMQSGVENAVEWKDYEVLEPMQRADGTTVVAGLPTFRVKTFGMITTSCKNPEVIMRWADSLYSQEMREYLIYGGIEGTDWEWVNGVKSISGEDRAVVSSLDAVERNAIWLPDWVGSWVTAEMYGNNAAESDSAEAPLRVADGKLYDKYLKETGIPQNSWCTDQDITIEFGELRTLIIDYLNTAISEFTLGTRDIDDDSEWQEYLDTLESMGYVHYCDVATRYYFQ